MHHWAQLFILDACSEKLHIPGQYLSMQLLIGHSLSRGLKTSELKRNSRQKATKAFFGIEYESNLRVKA